LNLPRVRRLDHILKRVIMCREHTVKVNSIWICIWLLESITPSHKECHSVLSWHLLVSKGIERRDRPPIAVDNRIQEVVLDIQYRIFCLVNIVGQ